MRVQTSPPVRHLAVLAATTLLLVLAGPAGPAVATGHHAPIGHLDSIRQELGGVRVVGWALDQDTAASIQVHAYFNGKLVTGFLADRPRSDIGRLYPALGPDHGFSTVIPLSSSPGTLCLYAINTPSGPNTRLACVGVNRDPFGAFDGVRRVPGGSTHTVRVAGWAIDPDTTQPIQVHVYANGKLLGGLLASRERPDVEKVHPGFGSAHGFAGTFLLGAGTHEVCAYAINTGPGANRLLGCRAASVTTLPIGHVDSIKRNGTTGASVVGWTIDPDTTAAISIEVRADGVLMGTLVADVPRSTIGGFDAVYGTQHGFGATVSLGTTAKRQVCIHAVNVELGSGSRLLGCKII